MTALAGGGFLILWSDSLSPASIKGQMFNADGSRSGGEFVLNAADAPYEQVQSVTALAGGGFVVSWRDQPSPGGADLRARIFDGAGTALGPELVLNTAQVGFSANASAATLTTGGFVAALTSTPGSPAVTVQRFDAQGARIGAEIQVSNAWYAYRPEVATLAGGGFAVAWHGDQGPSLRIYNSSGIAATGPLTVDTISGASNYSAPDVAVLASGDLVVTWTDTSDGRANVQARLFSSGGAPLGSEFLVHNATAGTQPAPSVVAPPNGGFVVSWTDSSDPAAIKARVAAFR